MSVYEHGIYVGFSVLARNTKRFYVLEKYRQGIKNMLFNVFFYDSSILWESASKLHNAYVTIFAFLKFNFYYRKLPFDCVFIPLNWILNFINSFYQNFVFFRNNQIDVFFVNFKNIPHLLL